MKRISLFGLLLVAMMGIASLVASAASAETIWLWESALIAEKLPASTEGELTLKDDFSGVEILCDGTFVGTIGPDAEDEITLVEDLEKHDNKLDCIFTAHGFCEAANGSLVEVTAINLPWKTLLELVGTEVQDSLTNASGNPGYLVECKVLGITSDVSCTGNTNSFLENGATDVIGKFSFEKSKAGSCSDGGAGTGLLQGEGLTFATGGGSLQVSEG